jgi:Ricin-type beta-trefoil lectin domain-like/Carbohydrate binding module (family 6)
MRNRIFEATIVGKFLCLTFVGLLALGTSAFAQNSTIFGPNVYVFTPSNSISSINSTLATLAGNGQFSTNRYAVLFEPGTYTGVESEVGFYESIAGLGQTPSAVNLSQGYLESNELINGNDTQTFWRSMENLEMTTPGSGTLQWGVSQGASIRRMLINNPVELTDSGCNYSSGGFIANTKITGQLNSCSQQQWYTRNSSLGSWTGGSWNMVFSGVSGAPAQSNPFGGGGSSHTVLATTPVSREKPFLYMDSSSNYWVFAPTYGTNTSGITWGSGGVGSGEAGTSLSISTFLIATPSTSLATINAALASGKNLILTPGIYQYSGAINVTNANTVVLGLGYADLVPQSGTPALTVADVDGVQLAGFLIDAGPVNSSVLLQVGVKGAPRVSHATNPTTISDVHFRVGGATLGTCSEATEIDSDNVIIDNMWSWRADHGNGGTVGWSLNVCNNGLVVNGDNVLATGLAVEHYEKEQVVWNGEGGETIFYQSEMPYDVPSEGVWMNGSVDGYASYNVAPTVANHVAYGLGVYSVFDQGVNIIANSGIAAPVAKGVTFHDMVSVTLSGGQINYTIASNNATVDNGGTTAGANSYVTSWGGTSGNCGGAPGTPGTPSGSGTSGSTINVSWSASSEGSNCTLSYNLFRSTAAGFTPSSSNMIASDLTAPSFIDSGLAATTTYYYVIQAVNAAGTSANSAQGNGTTITGSGGGTTEEPYGGTPAAIPGTVLAENYDTGGPGVGYSIATVNGSDNGYRSDGVDLETTSAGGGGNDIGWTAAGQWFRYTVNVATAGTYNVTFTVASPNAVTDGFHLSNASGANLTGSVNIPATGGYQTWATVTASVTLPVGEQVLTWNQDNGGYNLYSAAFASSGSGGGSTLTTGVFYNLVNENSGSCIDDTASGTANGTAVQQWACGQGTNSTQPNQQWEFLNGTASGYYYVANANAPTETWNVTGSGTTSGSLLQTWTYAGNPNEEWEAVPLGNGYYNFVGQGSGLCLDTPSASTANGVQLNIYTCNGTAAQAWKLVLP